MFETEGIGRYLFVIQLIPLATTSIAIMNHNCCNYNHNYNYNTVTIVAYGMYIT